MPVRWSVVVALCLTAPVAPASLSAQSATAGALVEIPVPIAPQRFAHRKRLHARYDRVADSTHLTVTTHKGKYFLTVQRPRLTWAVDYPGQTPNGAPPAYVTLEFRTQSPQVALNSRLTIDYGRTQAFEVPSAGAFSDPGVQTWSHYMLFPIPAESLATAVASGRLTVTVGTIVVPLKPDEINALGDLLARVGAWPPTGARAGP